MRNVRRETSRTFRNKKRELLTEETVILKRAVRINISGAYNGPRMTLSRMNHL
jgi:hypothetical protein